MYARNYFGSVRTFIEDRFPSRFLISTVPRLNVVCDPRFQSRKIEHWASPRDVSECELPNKIKRLVELRVDGRASASSFALRQRSFK